ncbi:Poly(U)-specific endoribonuclease [Orchesella cincta]|uniref:Poly(U)-specific endoribonuclease n=1 Tax=Orchesella cincta TaxID=48709 RepID=A0A1D2MTY7_ORCCI|nr:Poly(U)-specific endoribonuclease [Orchesella cincta]
MESIFKIQFLIVALLVAQAQASILRESLHFADDSCAGRCNVSGTVPGACQCNTACIRFDDCCPDYYTLCLGQGSEGSCLGKCDQQGTIPGAPYGVSNKELEDLAEELLGLDTEGNAAQYVDVNLQGRTSSGSNQDLAPLPLLTVTAAAYSRPSIQKLISLHEIYDANVNIGETYSAAEEAKINEFLDAIFGTPIMQRAQSFLASKNLPNGRDNFFELWFGLFSRGNGALGSCGLEHVFMAELRGSDDVLGFHNWVFFALEEAASRKGSILEFTFDWNSTKKPISSMVIGTSPELELALYTVCFTPSDANVDQLNDKPSKSNLKSGFTVPICRNCVPDLS